MSLTKKNFTVLCLTALPVSFWIFVILKYAVNIPWFDDLDPFPDFLRQWIKADSASEQIRLLFQPNNEHRMVLGKLSALFYYKFFGSLNFIFLQIVGACFTLGTFLLFWLSFRSSKINNLYFLPVPFLLFQLQYHLAFLWSITSLQHQSVIFFICFSIFLLSRDRFLLALLIAVCTTFVMSSGIFVWVGGAAILLWRLNFRHLAVWCVTGAMAIGLYFHGMTTQGNESGLDFLVQSPHLALLGLLTFLGGTFDVFPWLPVEVRSILPALFSPFVLFWIVVWLLAMYLPKVRQLFRVSWTMPAVFRSLVPIGTERNAFPVFLLGVLVFLFANATAIGLFRTRFGLSVMLVSNYKLYPALFLITGYLTFLWAFQGKILQKRIFQISLPVAILIWLLSCYNYLPAISERRKNLLIGAYNQNHNAYGLGHIPFSKAAAYYDSLMKETVQTGLYQYPEESSFLVPAIRKVENTLPVKHAYVIEKRHDAVRINDLTGNFSYGKRDGKFPFVINNGQLYLYKMDQHGYTGRNIFKQFDRGAGIEIPFSSMKPGVYKLGIVTVKGSEIEASILHQITIP
jgi:hypothetical protein